MISKRRLREFCTNCKEKNDAAIAERELLVWHRSIRAATPRSFADVKQSFPSADQVGNCTVFDIANNRHRLIARINYRLRIAYVLAVLTHADYDRQPWAEKCGCYRPAAKRPRKGT